MTHLKIRQGSKIFFAVNIFFLFHL